MKKQEEVRKIKEKDETENEEIRKKRLLEQRELIRKKKQDERKEDLANFVQTVFLFLFRSLLKINSTNNSWRGEETWWSVSKSSLKTDLMPINLCKILQSIESFLFLGISFGITLRRGIFLISPQLYSSDFIIELSEFFILFDIGWRLIRERNDKLIDLKRTSWHSFIHLHQTTFSHNFVDGLSELNNIIFTFPPV